MRMRKIKRKNTSKSTSNTIMAHMSKKIMRTTHMGTTTLYSTLTR